MTSPRTYFGFTLWPVLDDDTGRVDYWDVHDRGDTDGEGDPIASLFSTCEQAKTWVRKERKERASLRSLYRLIGIEYD